MTKLYKRIEDVPKEIIDAYDHHRYFFNPPPVTVKWDKLAWINYVRFHPDIEKLRNDQG